MNPNSQLTGSTRAGRPTRVGLALACATICILALAGTPARAAVRHNYLSRITEVPANSGAALTGGLSYVNSMTVDAGNLWVAEDLGGSVSRVDEFDASGGFVAQLNETAGLQGFQYGVAVGHSTGETQVYVGAVQLVAGEWEGRVAVFAPTGALLGVWSGADTPDGSFGPVGVNGVAVDSSPSLTDWASGDVYVADANRGLVDVFKPAAGGTESYVTQIVGAAPGEPFHRPVAVAVDQASGDVVIADENAPNETTTVSVLEPTTLGEYRLLRQLTGTPKGAFNRVNAVDVDSGTGDIFVTQGQVFAGSPEPQVDQFSAEGAYVGRVTEVPAGGFGGAGVGGVAVDSQSHRLYVGQPTPASVSTGDGGAIDVFGPNVVVPDVTTGVATGLTAHGATLNGTVDPAAAGAASCLFEWGTSPAFGQSVPCSAAVVEGNTPVAVQASLTGLQPDAVYYYRLQATNAHGTNPGEAEQDQQFTTTGPGTRGEAAAGVASTSASLEAQVDPHGLPTSYYFQYGATSAYGTDVPVLEGVTPRGEAIGSGQGYETVSAHLQALQSGAVYHYRVVVVSEAAPGEYETFTGPDQAFTTQTAGGGFALPDGRGWELVSPPDKQGAGLEALGSEQGADIQAAEAGGAFTYVANAPIVANPAGSRSLEATQVYSTRVAPGSWETQDITTPHNEGASRLAVGHAAEYKLFSADLSQGMVEPEGHTPLPPLPAGAEKTIYLRMASGGYRALVTSENVPAGTKFGGDGEAEGEVEFKGATPDLNHVVVSSRVPLTSDFVKGDATSRWLYEWGAGQLQLVSVLPENVPLEGTSNLGSFHSYTVRHAISNDGSRVFWESEGTAALYLRDMLRHETVQLGGAGSFEIANAEGSRAFFRSGEKLTAGATAGGGLYEFEVTSGAGQPLAGKLTDLTVAANVGERVGVERVIGASDDGTSVYFLAHDLLGDAPGSGIQNGNNLYLDRYDAATHAWNAPTFIAALSDEDAHSWGAEGPDLNEMTSRVSPNGRYLTFMSNKSLTGYVNSDANSGAADEEVYLYDASTARLVCASCNPTGARPTGLFEAQEEYPGPLVDYARNWRNRWLAASIPGWTKTRLEFSLYQSRYLSSDGRLFFNSADALVPGDVNGREDVYEYEPAGTGSCQPPGYGQGASDVFSVSADGCVALISAGTSSEESAFLDASEGGGDVFFLTNSRLAAQDYDTSTDVYDAHVCTGSEPCAAQPALLPPPCGTGDSCKAAPSPQPAIFGAPSSQTFSGAGNITAAAPARSVAPRSTVRARRLARALKLCRRESKRRRAACEHKARKRYAARTARARKSLPARTGR